MARSTAKPIRFVVAGQRQPVATRQTRGSDRVGSLELDKLDKSYGGRLKDSIRIGAQRSAGEGQVVVSADPGRDIVVLHIAGGPALVLHPENARDLMLAQSADASERGRTDQTQADAPGSAVTVPSRLQWRGLEGGVGARSATRGPGDVILWGIDVITDLVTDKAADFTASAVVRRVDAQVDPGVYSLQGDALLKLKGHASPMAQVPAAANGEPLLMFIHGTFSETSGTFSRLWVDHPECVRTLFEKYGDRVYALDHPTLGASPVANALTLANACPKGAKLHLVTHSRGGLVAEVLARVCGNPNDAFEPFTAKADKDQRRELRALAAVVEQRGIRVDRMVRVACPARGTLLASGRLDAYVSVFKWTLELAGIPVAPQLVDFLGEVAKRRADPALLPGLAAQIPDSPLVQWLHGANGTHATDVTIKGDLRVVAGDLEGDSVTSWLKTLLADAFYWTDNDLVVQTRSMYGGAPRDASATFVLDRGGKVSHFNYFSNERTAEAIVNALVHEQPHGFRKIGPLSWAGEVASGTRAPRDRTGAADKPAVVLLGLKRPEDQTPGDRDNIGLFYDDLVSFLSSTHEVIEFAFDWRRTMEDEGRRLADKVERALVARKQTDKAVRLLAHSAGGVVARTMQLVRPNVWKRLMARPGARLLMLGTPNEGFWAPMQVLSGDVTFGNALALTGPPFRDAAARQLMAAFPGFMQLQAGLLDPKLGLARHDTWRQLADADLACVLAQSSWHNLEIQRDAYRWGVPTQAILNRAVALRKKLEAQRKSGLLDVKDQVLLVVGTARFTSNGYDAGSDGLVYLDAPAGGDGRVTLESAMLPGVPTWQVDAEHATLATKKDAFAAYLELLETGTTELLAPLRAAGTSRGEASVASPPVRSRPSRAASFPEPLESDSDLYAVEGPRGPRPVPLPGHGTALRVTVINGDLTFVRQPLLLGHYRALRLTGTERVVDRLVGGAMSRSLKANLYPDAPGTHQVFVNTQLDPTNPWRLPRPEAAVVLGLGEEGKLRPTDLVKTVRQAAIAWAERLAEKPGDAHVPAFLELAATLIGSGGTGFTAGQAAQLIAQGVREANERLSAAKWPVVSDLHLIELYLDRATEAWRALQIQAAATPGHYVVAGTVQPGDGALSRPLDSGYRGADYDFISATADEGPQQDARIEYTLDTKRARAEVRAQSTQASLVRELVTSASNDRSQDTRIGRTLFQLLVPVEMEPFFSGTTEMVIELDGGTAGIPWELLDMNAEGGGDARPWAIRAKLLRKLRTADFRAQVADAGAESSILVIGEPECDPARYRRLPGARAEARAVARLLSELWPLAGGKVTSLISPEDPEQCGADARTVMNTLLERDWRIVHIAGHGEASEKSGAGGGVVLSGGTFLSSREIESMRVVPELVFVNCCHQAARNPAEVLGRLPDRALFAAGVAEKLIQIGVRCVIAAGWAVDDDAANAFATTFYGALLKGHRFVDAVAQAREVALARGGNTWAAYQCYGDPDWHFRPEAPDAQRPPTSPMEEFAGVGSPSGLRIALEAITVKSKFQGAGPEQQKPKLRYLEHRFGDIWGGIGQVAEAFGAAWAESNQREDAIRWYRQALAVENGTASMEAAEQLSNLLARVAAETVDRVVQQSPKHKPAPAPLAKAVRKAREMITEATTLLDKLIALHPTMERESLYGSAHKSLALLEVAAGRPSAEAEAIAGMKLHFQTAEAIGHEHGSSNSFYPALNRIAADLALNAGRRGWRGLDAGVVSSVRNSLAARVRDDPDFWSVAGQTELDVYEAVARRDLAGRRESIEIAYEDLHARVGAPRFWGSVYDTARFVLRRYASRVAGAERKAASAVLNHLETFARAERAMDSNATTKTRRHEGR